MSLVVPAGLLLLFCAEACAQLTATGPNLIDNPSFEDASAGGSLPAHWSGDKNVFRRDDRWSRTGRASLRYENQDRDHYVVCSQPVDLERGRLYRFSVWIKTQDVRGPDSGASICMEWSGADGRWLGGCYPQGVSGTSDWRLVSGVVRIPPEARSPRLLLYLRQHCTGTAWFDDVELVRVARPPLRTILVAPAYRGWILTDRAGRPVPDRIVVRAEADLTELRDHDLTNAQVELRARLRKVGPNGEPEPKVLQQCHARPARLTVGDRVIESGADLTFAASGLVAGAYEIETALLTTGGKQIAVAHERFMRMPDDFRPRSYIDQHRRLIVDGKPFFPLGMYWSSINEKDMAIYADSKFNCLMPYGTPRPDQMELAHKHGLKVIYSIKDWYHGSRYCPGFIKSIADEEPAIRKRVRAFRDHPALLAWYLNDELPLSYLGQLEAHQRIVAEEDPHHPTWVVLWQVHQVRQYRDTFDVIGTDPYPIGRLPQEGHTPSMARQWTAETARQLSYARPLWQVPQVFNWANYRKGETARYGRTPTYDEMRSMAWQCIAEGATGLILYSWFDIQRNPDVPFEEQWLRLKRLAAEIDRMVPILLSVEPAPPARVIVPDLPDGVLVLVRRHGGKLYIVAVDDGSADAVVCYRLRTSHPIKVLNENRTIQPTVDGFVDRLKRLAVHIYQIEP